ncbi:MAG: cbb3-type cytochrome c oxidase subunit I [Spirochaetes bacterium]|nr:cbb3-type cytochrome c oxidase subunit I [Spirochaetota bacterium]
MSEIYNPYQSPESPIVPETQQNTGVMLSEKMLGYLNDASPWLQFIGILGYIGSGLLIVGGIFGAVGLSAASFLELGDFPFWIIALIYIPLGVLFFFPAHFAFNFGRKIRNYRFSNSIEDLELAFKNNKSLWKFYGIICIIYLAFIPLFFVIVIIGGVAAAVSGF